MNLLVFGDLHLKESELLECSLVLNEIFGLCQKYNVDQVINLGDTFDTLKPESECLDLFANFITKLHRPLICLAANSHESTTSEKSIMNHFAILHEGVKVCKEYIDESYLYCGHFILNESNINYGSTKSAEEFQKYRYVLLGHQHSLQAIGKNILHLGSCRYIDFAESQDKAKVVLLIENYKAENETRHLIGLKSVFPMKDVYVVAKGEKAPHGSSVAHSEEELRSILDNFDAKTKFRVIFRDFDTYSKVINSLSTYKDKFILFKIKQEFIISDTGTAVEKNKDLSIRDYLIKYLEEKKIPEEIKNIILEKV